jgi:hypothetical protein
LGTALNLETSGIHPILHQFGDVALALCVAPSGLRCCGRTSNHGMNPMAIVTASPSGFLAPKASMGSTPSPSATQSILSALRGSLCWGQPFPRAHAAWQQLCRSGGASNIESRCVQQIRESVSAGAQGAGRLGYWGRHSTSKLQESIPFCTSSGMWRWHFVSPLQGFDVVGDLEPRDESHGNRYCQPFGLLLDRKLAWDPPRHHQRHNRFCRPFGARCAGAKPFHGLTPRGNNFVAPGELRT